MKKIKILTTKEIKASVSFFKVASIVCIIVYILMAVIGLFVWPHRTALLFITASIIYFMLGLSFERSSETYTNRLEIRHNRDLQRTPTDYLSEEMDKYRRWQRETLHLIKRMAEKKGR